MDTLKDRFGLRGGVISAVDLLKGIGHYAGLEALSVEGATGYTDTNFSGKAERAIDKVLATRFFLDNSRYDVTVLNDEAEITGKFILRMTQRPPSDRQMKDIQRYFHYGTIDGVHRYVFHLRSGPVYL